MQPFDVQGVETPCHRREPTNGHPPGAVIFAHPTTSTSCILLDHRLYGLIDFFLNSDVDSM
jgi:hypothetical protein